jgi:LmbE family N-acetylglucosaminyl deacetylase
MIRLRVWLAVLLLIAPFIGGMARADTAAPSLTIRYDRAMAASALGSTGLSVGRAGSSMWIAKLEKGDACVIIGEMDDGFYVDYKGFVGYAPKSKLAPGSVISPEEGSASAWDIHIKNQDLPWLIAYKTAVPLRGTIISSLPLTEINIYLVNLRTMGEDCGCRQTYKLKDGVFTFDLGPLGEKLAIDKLGPGDKYLAVTAASGTRTSVLYYSPLCVKGASSRQASVTLDCGFNIGIQNVKNMTDNSRFTGWPLPRSGKPLIIAFPKGKAVGSMQVEWYNIQKNISLACRDGDGQLLLTCQDPNADGFLSTYYEFPEGTRSVEISAAAAGNSIVELFVYEKGRVPQVTQQWKALPPKVDIMLFAAHRDDELLFFGGTLPLYNAKGKTVAVVYMTVPEGRGAYAETLAALWSAGQRYYPVYLGFLDERNTYELSVYDWGGYDAIYKKVVEVIRKYKPDVILTHDVKGEFGHYQHILTSLAVREAAVLAAGAINYPESAMAYGVWDTPKLYVHLYAPETRVNAPFAEPMNELMGFSPMQAAYIAFEKHASEAGKVVYDLDTFGKKYDNTCFGLYRSTVGSDIRKDDFFENIR